LGPVGIQGASSLSDRLWFSVQTLSTIGDGGMTPVTPWAKFLVTIESFIGLAGVAIVTAILYAKFLLPEARVGFSNAIAVHDRQGIPTLHIRLLNQRTTPILDATLHVAGLLEEPNGDESFRRLVDVDLVRHCIPLFVVTFTALHALDDNSLLHAIWDNPELMAFLIVTIRGVDDCTLQPVFARALFHHDQLAFGKGLEVDAKRLNDLVPRAMTY
jgi:inward rectifier potassium channel